MTVQANWHIDLVTVDDDDPFAGVDVTQVGRRIDLRDETGLNEQLAGLLNEESRLFNDGVTCGIKDNAQSSCSACPVRCTDLSPLASLCSVGLRQERVLTMLVINRERATPTD